MFAQMAVFAVHRQHHIGQKQAVHVFQIGAVGVARNVVFAIAVIHNGDTLFRKGVDHFKHFTLIARNGFRGKQKRIPLAQFQAQIFAARQLRRSGTAFALAAGDDQHQVFAWHLLGIFGADVAGKTLQHARFFACQDHLLHGPPQQTNRAARRPARFGQGFQPRHV